MTTGEIITPLRIQTSTFDSLCSKLNTGADFIGSYLPAFEPKSVEPQ
jgi:hypothetical protein